MASGEGGETKVITELVFVNDANSLATHKRKVRLERAVIEAARAWRLIAERKIEGRELLSAEQLMARAVDALNEFEAEHELGKQGD